MMTGKTTCASERGEREPAAFVGEVGDVGEAGSLPDAVGGFEGPVGVAAALLMFAGCTGLTTTGANRYMLHQFTPPSGDARRPPELRTPPRAVKG